jgi:hypothetical protein
MPDQKVGRECVRLQEVSGDEFGASMLYERLMCMSFLRIERVFKASVGAACPLLRRNLIHFSWKQKCQGYILGLL